MNMHEKMRKLMNAYMDGELHGTTLQEMERHLSGCSACREELDELQRLSSLLKAAPTPEFIPVERFTANLALNLPRRELKERAARPGSVTWWMIPAGLMLGWFFLRTVLTLSGLLSVVDSTGLLGQASAWIGGEQASFWFPAAASIFADRSAEAYSTLSLANSINVFGASLLSGFLWQAFIALLYGAWLAYWWFTHRPQETARERISIRS
jgi:anti-sigma factor RsiW